MTIGSFRRTGIVSVWIFWAVLNVRLRDLPTIDLNQAHLTTQSSRFLSQWRELRSFGSAAPIIAARSTTAKLFRHANDHSRSHPQVLSSFTKLYQTFHTRGRAARAAEFSRTHRFAGLVSGAYRQFKDGAENVNGMPAVSSQQS